MFTLFKPRPKLPASFDRWKEVDGIAGSEFLYEGPSVLEVRSLKQWLDAYERWRAGYNAFIKAAGTPDISVFTDDFDRRQYEHYTGLFFQSGQWHAILLMLLEDISDPERSRYLAEIDGFLAGLRERMTIPQPQHMSLHDLQERLQQEVSSLTGIDLTWWLEHRVLPFAARYGQSWHFIVAASAQNIVFFADDEDEFGVAKLETSNQTITDYGLVGDLRDAVQIIRKTTAHS